MSQNSFFNLNQIYCMDCLEGLSHIEDNSVTLGLIDPPYNIGKAEWDSNPDFLNFIEKVFKEYKRILKNNGSIWVFASSWHLPKVCTIFDQIFHRKNIIIWTYSSGRVTQNGFSERYEPILYGVQDKNNFIFNADDIRIPRVRIDERYRTKYNIEGKVPESVWHYERLVWTPSKHIDGFHPSKKPLTVIERIIKCSSNKEDLVVDSFMGSGTTAVACKKLNRNYIGFEIDSNYCKIAERRLAKTFSAKHAFGGYFK